MTTPAEILNTPPKTVEEALARVYPPAVPQPCNDCPWRRNALPGWLGPQDADAWLDCAHGEVPIACHMTIPPGGGWGPKTRQCAGAASFRAHVFKAPHNPTIAVGPDDPNVFATNAEFKRYHEGDEGDKMDERIKSLIQRQVDSWGYSVKAWREDEDGLLADLGRFVVTEDDEDDEDYGFYEGDEGELSASVVGAAEHGNERVAFHFMPDGYDSPNEVRDLSILNPA